MENIVRRYWNGTPGAFDRIVCDEVIDLVVKQIDNPESSNISGRPPQEGGREQCSCSVAQQCCSSI